MRCQLNTLEVARSIINALEDKKGEDILLLDIQEISSFTDYFVICSGSSDRMLDALSDTAVEAAKKNYKINGRIEGGSKSGWVVVDLGDVVGKRGGMEVLRRLSIEGFKSLRKVGVEFPQFTVLFGPNAAGKSNLLDAVQALSRI